MEAPTSITLQTIMKQSKGLISFSMCSYPLDNKTKKPSFPEVVQIDGIDFKYDGMRERGRVDQSIVYTEISNVQLKDAIKGNIDSLLDKEQECNKLDRLKNEYLFVRERNIQLVDQLNKFSTQLNQLGDLCEAQDKELKKLRDLE